MVACMLSNRISSYFDLTGPSVTIDTNCSSTLVALDVACGGLRRGTSSLVEFSLVVCSFGPMSYLLIMCKGNRRWLQSTTGPRILYHSVES